MLLASLAWGTQGCVSGHLFDAARRRERPIAYGDARVDEGRLVLAYTALVTDDLDRPLARVERRAALALADLRRTDIPVESFPVERLADREPPRGISVALRPIGSSRGGAAPALEIEDGPDGKPSCLVLHDAADERYPPFYSNALGQTSTAAWVYPLLPLGFAIDAVTLPLLVVLSPLMLGLGD